ncbi:Hypothetical predicted protein [Mytilus galloprovincialis]|uniref:Mab-21-like HhH/H2TH-like domain-containing protein n=1 Tax=Mytilus galloprovincialis TaxID=29158 RepID=A0A8B6DLI0_MYTGA|nr:Hypothetical predicted protein [Mytilus galloprovincialis]
MDSEEDVDEKRQLSELVSDILKWQGFYMEYVAVIRSECLLSEKITKDLFGSTVIKCGSSVSEGSDLQGSDKDHMHVIPKIIAVNSNCKSVLLNSKMHIFTMALENCLPGYTRLLVKKLNQKCAFRPKLQTMIKEEGNRFFLSSEELYKNIQNIYIKFFTSRYGIRCVSFNSNGPCTTCLVYNIKGISGKVEHDMTQGIECFSWPVAATEWIYRPRLMGWPSQEIIKKIAALKVHVMPVGDPKSDISSMQWRFAFSEAERELIWNFSDFQFQCYVLMKGIFKIKLKPFSPNEISGYQIKMLLFWISEEYGVKIFTKENLLHCVEICFERYKDQILNCVLPHYIFRDRNLLAGKLEIQTRQQIADEIDNILKDIFVTVMECKHIMPIPSNYMFQYYKGSKRNFLRDLTSPLNLCITQCSKKLKLKTFEDSLKVCLEMIYTPKNFKKLTAFIEDMDLEKNRYNKIFPYMLNTAKMFGFIQLGLMFNEDSFDEKTPEEKDILFHKANSAFKRGMELDEFSGKLYLVSFLLLNDKIDTALSILSSIMQHTKPFVYTGYCSTDIIHVLQFYKTEILYFDYYKDNLEVSNCYDMIFPNDIVNFVPKPIKYELFLQQCTKEWHVCRYHPVVYAFYLMFEMTRKKGGKIMEQNNILNKLSRFIEDCNGGVERHRAYNVLAFCYYTSGQIDAAIAAYCQSLQEKFDFKNVAFYHLCTILLEHITSHASVFYSRK